MSDDASDKPVAEIMQSTKYTGETTPIVSALQQRGLFLEAEVGRLHELVYVPGAFRCAKCNFRLIATTLNVAVGAAYANNAPQDCPNGCGPLWRISERDAGNEISDQVFSFHRALIDHSHIEYSAARGDTKLTIWLPGHVESKYQIVRALLAIPTVEQTEDVRKPAGQVIPIAGPRTVESKEPDR